MLLRSSISNTMKLLQKTLENIKSCFSPSYQKLPKTPHRTNQFPQSSYKDLELDKLYSDFTKQWDSEKGRRRRSKKKMKPREEENKENLISLNNAKKEKEKREECEKQKQQKKSLTCIEREKQQVNSKGMSIMAKKLREMEKLEKNNVDYVLDIEEVLHYYSRLTCPLYLEIVDKFFMQMYEEFFGDSLSLN